MFAYGGGCCHRFLAPESALGAPPNSGVIRSGYPPRYSARRAGRIATGRTDHRFGESFFCRGRLRYPRGWDPP
jgi:hypothetical protein